MKNLILILFIVIGSACYSQNVNYNKIIMPNNSKDTLDFVEKLIQLAWKNYPINEVNRLNREVAKKEVTLAKKSWGNNLQINLNANEATINSGIFAPYQPGSANQFFPRYNAGVLLNIGTLISTPTRVKIAKDELKIADANINSAKLAIRAEVISRYQEYITAIEILKLRIKASDEASIIHLLVTKKFKKGETDLEEYNKSFLTFNNAQEGRVNAENMVSITKARLEELIGLKLEDISNSKIEDIKSFDKKGDTIITANGLKYIVIEPGFGEKPKNGQTVKIYYTGKLLNGKEFESNTKDPSPFKFILGTKMVIAGWDEGIPLMREGEKGKLIIPARLAYGKAGIKQQINPDNYLIPPDNLYSVPPDTPVVFDIELVDIK
ncbi:MAG: hypothetical protein EAZ07_06205 [Cytophagales bacterium]|nr:MAG: hypothetical protein EAZ07_06205 [Cytophagales bacterium]